MTKKGLAWYYVTRLAMVALWLLAATVAGLPIWASALPAAGMIAYFVWVPRSGRYVVRQDQPLAPMRRDERSLAISGRAATWGFVVETLLVSAGVVWGVLSHQQGLIGFLALVLAAGTLTYLVAQVWLGRKN
jgi:membrane protein DedA with SNARE-associated domain